MNAGGQARLIRTRLVACAAIASLVLVACAVSATYVLSHDTAASQMREKVVALNETRASLNDVSASSEADQALVEAQETLRRAADVRGSLPIVLIWVLCAAGVAVAWGVVVNLYVSVVRPFTKLEHFASEVAAGNLDMPLAYERTNPFGRFTWAFDNMRTEIKRARAAEAEAFEQGKTSIAALSHDIKTPIASIRAYSEALELGLARDEEERASYARTIARKCEEVTRLTDDLFLHALADLDRISVEPVAAPIHETLRAVVADFDATGDVSLVRLDHATVRHDPKRLAQALENLIANARKYAPGSPVEVAGVALSDGGYRVDVRDFGPGIVSEDLPFACDRFYRGRNAHDAPGAGLGLFIVSFLVNQMGGAVRLENAAPGLRAALEFPPAP